MEVTKQPTAIICLSPYRGGMELDAISFVTKLSKHMKTIIIVKHGSFMHEKLKEEGNIKYKTISFRSNLGISLIRNSRKIIQIHKIKNVIFFGASELKSLYFAFLGLNINLIIRHSTTKSSPKKDWFHKLIYKNVNYHIATSKHLEKNISYIIPLGASTKVRMIYSSFNFSKPNHLSHDGINIVHTGRIADAKGQTDAILACKILIENNIKFKLYIVGGYDDSYKETFLRFMNKIDYQENIIFTGFTNNVSKYINQADIFMFPSHGEGLSLSFREALANNLVCLSYNNTSFPELKDLGLYFHLCENKEIKSLNSKLLYVCQNITTEKQLANNNNKIIQEIFSEQKEINQYLDILR